jgi:hypothetical protein
VPAPARSDSGARGNRGNNDKPGRIERLEGRGNDQIPLGDIVLYRNTVIARLIPKFVNQNPVVQPLAIRFELCQMHRVPLLPILPARYFYQATVPNYSNWRIHRGTRLATWLRIRPCTGKSLTRAHASAIMVSGVTPARTTTIRDSTRLAASEP